MKIKVYRGNNNISHNLDEISAGSTRLILECGWDQSLYDGIGDFGDVAGEGLTYGESTYDAVFVLNHQTDHRGLMENIQS